MQLGEQGLLEYFVQTKILGWSQVDRIKFMSDPIFHTHFKKLLQKLFPSLEKEETQV
jgi:hypothetical protein